MNYKTFFKERSPLILTIIGGVGVIATGVECIKATPKALELIKQREEETGKGLTKLEVIKTAWRPYIFPGIICGCTIGCIFGANALNAHSQAMLASAYGLASETYKEYYCKDKELNGAEHVTEVQNAMAKESYDEQRHNHKRFKQLNIKDKHLFWDFRSSNWFELSIEELYAIEAEFNRYLKSNGYATLNDLYDMLGAPRTVFGDYEGWTSNSLTEEYGLPEVRFAHARMRAEEPTEEGEEALEIYIFECIDEPIEGYMY